MSKVDEKDKTNTEKSKEESSKEAQAATAEGQAKTRENEQSAQSSRSAIKLRMKEASKTLEAVSNMYSTDPIYSTYLRFSMNDLVLETTSKDINKNLIMSFSNNKNGSGFANSFSLRIAYAPGIGENFDINKIDNAIVRGTKHGFEYSSRYCQIQYGYADTLDKSLRTVTYNGLVMDYDSEIQDGMLVYNITGYSSIVMWNESKDAIAIDTDIADADGKVKPTAAFRNIVEKYLSEAPSSSHKPYEIKFDDNVEGSDAAVELPASLDKNVGKALDDILKKAVLQSDYDELEANPDKELENPTMYTWFISDQSSSDEYDGTIWVVMYDKKQLKELNADANLVFNWMSPGAKDELNHIVMQFRPEFKGSVLLAQAAKKLNSNLEYTDEEGNTVAPTDEGLYTGSYFADNEGKLQKCQNTNSSVAGGDLNSVIINNESNNSRFIHELTYPYKASMVTTGIPCELPITGVIKIVPMIYGQPHFSNGNYMILGNTDEIDSGGRFTTSWDLMKIDTTVDNDVDNESEESISESKSKSDAESELKSESKSESNSK